MESKQMGIFIYVIGILLVVVVIGCVKAKKENILPADILKDLSEQQKHELQIQMERSTEQHKKWVAELPKKKPIIDAIGDRCELWVIYSDAELRNLFFQTRVNTLIAKSEAKIKQDPDFGEAHFNLAFCYSLKNEKTKAIESLKKAIELDIKFLDEARTDPAFDNIKNTPEFQRLITP